MSESDSKPKINRGEDQDVEPPGTPDMPPIIQAYPSNPLDEPERAEDVEAAEESGDITGAVVDPDMLGDPDVGGGTGPTVANENEAA